MTPVRPLVLLLLLAATAAPALASPPGWHQIGPCLVLTPEYAPSNGLSARCVVDGSEVAYASVGRGWVGYHCAVRAAGATLHECPPGFPHGLLP